MKNVVVIYAENRSFDNLYGNFPGANGVASLYDANGNLTSAYVPQKDRNGNVLATLPQTWGGVTAGGVPCALSRSAAPWARSASLAAICRLRTSASAVCRSRSSRTPAA